MIRKHPAMHGRNLSGNALEDADLFLRETSLLLAQYGLNNSQFSIIYLTFLIVFFS